MTKTVHKNSLIPNELTKPKSYITIDNENKQLTINLDTPNEIWAININAPSTHIEMNLASFKVKTLGNIDLQTGENSCILLNTTEEEYKKFQLETALKHLTI